MLLSVAWPDLAAAAAPTSITAGHAIVLDPDTGQVLFERDSRARIAPASLTKVMTALVAIERTDLDQTIAITPGDLIGEASMGLRDGEEVSLGTLLYGLLLPSGNDAAMAIARGVGAGSGDAAGPEAVARFIGWMNETAARLGLRDTRFVNPHGLDAAGHYSSAYDLARLTGIAWRDPLFARIFGTTRYQAEGHVLAHGHRLVGKYDGVVGGKTGLTDGCGFCLITAAEHDARRLVVVVLRDGIAQAFADTATLLAWSYAELDAGHFPVTAALPPAPSPAPLPSAAPITPATPAPPPPATILAVTTSPAALRSLHTPPSSQERLRPLLIAALATMLACGLLRRIWP